MMSLYFHVFLIIELRYFCMAWDIYDALTFLVAQYVAIKFILHEPLYRIFFFKMCPLETLAHKVTRRWRFQPTHGADISLVC